MLNRYAEIQLITPVCIVVNIHVRLCIRWSCVMVDHVAEGQQLQCCFEAEERLLSHILSQAMRLLGGVVLKECICICCTCQSPNAARCNGGTSPTASRAAQNHMQFGRLQLLALTYRVSKLFLSARSVLRIASLQVKPCSRICTPGCALEDDMGNMNTALATCTRCQL